jgi:hypothetical protein
MTVRKIPHRNIALVLAAALILVLFTGIASADVCIVADPTGTPLNVRKRPSQHAPIIGALNNGIAVQTKMSLGDWVRIVPHEAPGKSGWAWRAIIARNLEGESRGGRCSANEIASWSGQSLREVERYTRAADQARLARNALARTAIVASKAG